ncbi:MAG: methyltransferase [Rhodospirillaceae bacterium]|nr:methyltransferase [Rhodospirillaceae bacterium]
MDMRWDEPLTRVTATLNYLAPMSAKPPVVYTFEPPPGVPWRTAELEPRTVAVRDARPAAARLSLDAQGFAFLHAPTAAGDLYDDAVVRSVYLPETERLVRAVTGAARVVAFDYNRRSAPRAAAGEGGVKEPVKRVHNDFTAASGRERARAELEARGEDPAALLCGRFAIVNLWRPIRGPVEESPLAVCDAGTIEPGDLVATSLVYRDRVGEVYSVTFSPRHRWFFFPRMERDEVLLIKCCDSAEDGTARFTAHTAFDDPGSPPDATPRESIEVRTLVLFDSPGRP